MKQMRFFIGLIWILVLVAPSEAWAYKEVEVRSEGTLTGRVFLNGSPPPARIYHLIFSPNIAYCRNISDGLGNRLLREFRVSELGGFQDVIVSIIGVEHGKPFDFTPTLDIEHCRITPFVTPIRNHHPIAISNKDPITHDVQAYTLKGDYTFAMFNKPMPAHTDVTREVLFRKGHYLFRTQCGVHDYMQSWGMAVGNPYFAVTDKSGYFEILNVPPGTYYVIAWHPHMKVQAKEVRMGLDETVSIEYTFDAAEVHIPLHDLQLNYRLSTWLKPHHLAPPSVELQLP
ncbi:carboxypeptidase regulatory-like domain-containing protein [Nitrospira defluvii]|nr:carboxypeptidase regulatory-like domain-containing protein [Nitrospira defluvii]